jgi:ABC-2 type transport system ATP-binding protein
MKREVLEIEVDRLADAQGVLDRHGVETAIFGSVLHATVEDGKEAEQAIRAILREAGVDVIRIEAIIPSLEDVFVTMIEAA